MQSFPELREFDRDRICLEACVLDGNLKTEISQSAWSLLIPTLPRLNIVDVRIASPGPPKYTTTSRALAVEPSLYHDANLNGPQTNPVTYRVQAPPHPTLAAEPSPYRDANLKGPQTNPVTYGAQAPSYSSRLSELDSHTTRVMVDIITNSSRGGYSPRPLAC